MSGYSTIETVIAPELDDDYPVLEQPLGGSGKG